VANYWRRLPHDRAIHRTYAAHVSVHAVTIASLGVVAHHPGGKTTWGGSNLGAAARR
jgi:hypothetical protein